MESVDAKRFGTLGLTRSEERLLRQVTGLRDAERTGRLERIFYNPWGPSLDLMIVINLVAVFYAAFWSADVVIAVTSPLMFFIFCVVLSRRNGLVNKLYRTLEIERESSAPASVDTACDLQP